MLPSLRLLLLLDQDWGEEGEVNKLYVSTGDDGLINDLKIEEEEGGYAG